MDTIPSRTNIAVVSSPTEEARIAHEALCTRYPTVPLADADVIVALGGDGLMLETLHRAMGSGKPIYGMNRGSVGFLMNEFSLDHLEERLASARTTCIRPLLMRATDSRGDTHQAHAVNEVSLLRQTYQAAKLRIRIDDRVRLEELVCDGIILATPAGSTAYNLSAHGPILPIDAQLLALTPISAFRPRRWRGALLSNRAQVTIEILTTEKRPVAAAADNVEIRDVVRVDIAEDRKTEVLIMFDPHHSWDERILAEQFQY